jgi:hypothetical protein
MVMSVMSVIKKGNEMQRKEYQKEMMKALRRKRKDQGLHKIELWLSSDQIEAVRQFVKDLTNDNDSPKH